MIWKWSLLILVVGLSITASMLRPQSPLPSHIVNQNSGWADESTCIECHDEALHFLETGHARTLTRSTSGSSVRTLKSLQEFLDRNDTQLQVHIDAEQVLVTQGGPESSKQMTLDWCFGSGAHAQTWVSILNGSWGASDLAEFRWTWYHHLNEFDITPGQADQPQPGYFGHLGVLYDHPKTRRCFACHATYLPVDQGRIDFDHMLAGVTCQRCHGPRGEHLETEGKAGYNTWAGIDHVEAVKRCAECHRLEEDVEGEVITADNPNLARFQPVGLMNSACFQSQQMTCTICHDPHRPLSEQKLDGIWQCTQCHDGDAVDRPVCSANHLDNCVRCHMPKVEYTSPLLFTDHWIRIPDQQPQPAISESHYFD